jgi:predicted Rossmann fold nucleotide-binding protein DprA/Smf involved in DNA uptake
MAKRDKDIFERLRRVGLRKQVARALSEIGDGTSKRAVNAARSLVGELRSLADELERRLPDRAAEPAPAAARAARSSAKPAPRAKPARPAGNRTPPGANKAKILAALSSGPKTASQVAADTGIKTGTASTTLTKMLAAGDVVKAARGYALPG